jgi:hypothetical protein
VHSDTAELGAPGRRKRAVFLAEAEREDQVDGESGAEGGPSRERVDTGLAAGQDAAADLSTSDLLAQGRQLPA